MSTGYLKGAHRASCPVYARIAEQLGPVPPVVEPAVVPDVSLPPTV